MKFFTTALLTALFITSPLSPSVNAQAIDEEISTTCGISYAVVANRGSGDVTFIPDDGRNTTILVNLPMGTNGKPEPMYVNFAREKLFIGDRKNSAIVVLDPKEPSSVPFVISGVANGIFHQWSNEDTLVVACDTSQTVTIISLETMSVEMTIDLLNQMEFSISSDQKPHDIIITPKGDAIFVTIVGDGTADDAILKIDPTTKQVIAKVNIDNGADSHLALAAAQPDLLFSPQQNLNRVAVYKQFDLSEAQDAINIDNAHGIGSNVAGNRLYVSNIANGGTEALNVIMVKKDKKKPSSSLLEHVVDTPNSTPHNVAVTKDNSVFVTHSGPTATDVSLFTLNEDGLPVFDKSFATGGINPFGLTIANYKCSKEKKKQKKSKKQKKGKN